jgi:hypothetical protein
VSTGLELVDDEGRQPNEDETMVEPERQEEHEEELPKEYEFAGQIEQPDALVVPGFFTVPA